MCLNKLEDAYLNDRGKLWNTINSLIKIINTYDEPTGQDLVIHFKQLSAPHPKDYFTSTLENEAKQFFFNYVQAVSLVKNDVAYNIITIISPFKKPSTALTVWRTINPQGLMVYRPNYQNHARMSWPSGLHRCWIT